MEKSMDSCSPKRMLEAALQYEKQGFSVLPVAGNKKPLVKWEEFQRRRASSEEIKGWWKKYPEAMVAIVTGAVSGVDVLDVDDPNADLSPIVPSNFLATPTATTPRGGRHLYYDHPGESIGNATGVIPGVDFRGDGGYVVAPPSENGSGKPYAWLPGLSIFEAMPQALPAELKKALLNNNKLKGGVGGNRGPHESVANPPVQMFTEGRRDNDIFHTLNRMARGGASREELAQTAVSLGKLCTPPFSEKEALTKVESVLRRSANREGTIRDEILRFISVATGVFSVAGIATALQGVAGDAKKNTIRNALWRLWKEGVIKKVGDKDGVYCRVENDLEEINIFAEDVRYHRVLMPLGLNEMVHIMEKNVIIVAGAPDSGKTAFMLNVAKDNLDDSVTYFSSEMGQLELRSRLEKFDFPLDHWKKIRFLTRSTNFADVIDPEGINIIDYLEIHDDFYKIGGLIKDIFDKLNRGVAFIAIQKPTGRGTGLGGERTLEKARLYVSLDRMQEGQQYNVARIMKAKNWRDPTLNPNGLQLFYKLVKGHDFQIVDTWHREDGQGKGRKS